MKDFGLNGLLVIHIYMDCLSHLYFILAVFFLTCIKILLIVFVRNNGEKIEKGSGRE